MTDCNEPGTIFDIKRFAIHDGEGIRTTLFVKGCPLRCPWCHNPEGRSKAIELMWFSSLCVQCGQCAQECTQNALELKDRKVKIDRRKCTLNAACTSVCPTNALKLDGWTVTSQQAFEELVRDEIFYMDQGGVTLSGGDPLAQIDFTRAVLRLCKQRGLNTAIETCLFASEADVMSLVPFVDEFLIDIKIMDDEKHRKTVGVSNAKILRNFEALCRTGADIRVRVPIIPGFTDDDENIESIARYVVGVRSDVSIELLNYNPLAENKFDTIDEQYMVGKGVAKLTSQEMDEKKNIIVTVMEA